MRSCNLILASASPRRLALLKEIPWLTATVFPSAADERFDPALSPEAAAVTLAERKASSVWAQTGGVVLGADTLVTIDGRILGKPRSADEAAELFRLLCGRTHAVITGYCVLSAAKKVRDFEKTLVTFRAFLPEIVYTYIESGAPYDKAGGYGIQDASLAPLIGQVRGDRNNVIGLPVAKLEQTLKEFY